MRIIYKVVDRVSGEQIAKICMKYSGLMYLEWREDFLFPDTFSEDIHELFQQAQEKGGNPKIISI